MHYESKIQDRPYLKKTKNCTEKNSWTQKSKSEYWNRCMCNNEILYSLQLKIPTITATL